MNIHQSDEIEICTDKQMLNTVLRNLISNAVKFTEKGGKIDIYVDFDNENAEIIITDNVVCMPKEVLNRLFRYGTSISMPGTEAE